MDGGIVEVIGSKGCSRIFVTSIKNMKSPVFLPTSPSTISGSAGPAKIGPFSGLVICVTGLSKEARQQVMAAAERLGGQYSSSLHPSCTHLVVQSCVGRKFEHALKHGQRNGLFIVTLGWFVDSVRKSVRLNESLYAVKNGENGSPLVESNRFGFPWSETTCFPLTHFGDDKSYNGVSNTSQLHNQSPWKECSSGPLFSSDFIFVDPDLSIELRKKVVDAASREGAKFLDHWFIGSPANHIVCESPSIQKYIGHVDSLVTPLWVFKTIKEKCLQRQVHLSSDLVRQLALILENSQINQTGLVIMDNIQRIGGSENISSSGSVNDPKNDPKHRAKSNDPGWKYGFWPDLNDKNLVRCKLCDKDTKGGIKRLKEHLIGGYGDVKKCSKATEEISTEMREFMTKNKKKKIIFDFEEENQEKMDEDNQTISNEPSSGSASKKRKELLVDNKAQKTFKGTIDSFVRRAPEEVIEEKWHKGSTSQTTIENKMRSEDERKKLRSYFARWAYESGVPFNALNSKSFHILVEAIGQYGPGFKPPSMHDYRVSLLKSEVEAINEIKLKHQASWRNYGCTLMSDGWTDKRGRHLINFLVNSPDGTFFLGSVDASSQIQDANMLLDLFDKKVCEIGEDNVVQLVTDNAANCKKAGELLMRRRKKIFWTPCAAHCIDLMLEDVGRIKSFKKVISKAMKLTSFIYRHARILDALRVKTKGADLVRAGITRFASSFLTLQSILKHQEPLRQLFVSDEWVKCKVSTTQAGKNVEETVLSGHFWNVVKDCLRASMPLLQLLRIVDGDERPALPEVFMAMIETKKAIIKNFGEKEKEWKNIISIVEKRWENQMDRPLYSAAFFVNPSKYFKCLELHPDISCHSISDAFNDVIERLEPDLQLQDKIVEQASLYSEAIGSFAKDMAVRQRDILNPVTWWQRHGSSAPELCKIAIRLLSLCCSSSGCERNWSTFEFIHSKRRNRLEHQRLNDIVYIQYNRRLQTRFQDRRESGRNFNPLILEEINWSSEWMTGQPEDDLVHPNEDLTWNMVDREVGASTSFQNLNRSRRIRNDVSSDDEALDVENVYEDDDIEDDFGISSPIEERHSDEEDATIYF